MAHGDRISALDASFLHLEKAGERLHVASVTIFDGPAPTWDELRAHVEGRLHLVPRFRQRLAEVPLRPGPPGLGRRPALQPALPPAPRRPAGARLRGAAEEPRRPPVRPAAGPHEAAVGAVARRRPLGRAEFALDRQEPPRARRRRARGRHHAGAVRRRTGRRAAGRDRRAPGSRAPSPPPPSCSPTRCSSARPSRSELARSARAAVRGPRHLLQGARDRLQASGALTFAGLEPAPPTPLNVKVGPHRRYTWVDAELAELRAIKDVARRHGQRRDPRRRRRRARPLPAPPRRRHARPRAQGARADLRALRGSRARQRRRAARRAAAGRHRGPRRAVPRDPRLRQRGPRGRARRSTPAR